MLFDFFLFRKVSFVLTQFEIYWQYFLNLLIEEYLCYRYLLRPRFSNSNGKFCNTSFYDKPKASPIVSEKLW